MSSITPNWLACPRCSFFAVALYPDLEEPEQLAELFVEHACGEHGLSDHEALDLLGVEVVRELHLTVELKAHP